VTPSRVSSDGQRGRRTDAPSVPAGARRATTYDNINNYTWNVNVTVLISEPTSRWRAPRAAALRVYVRVSFTA
jgi:hypothetical protein